MTGKGSARDESLAPIRSLPLLKLIRHQFGKGVGPMADAVFFCGVDFGEAAGIALVYEYRVIAEAFLPARGPGQRAIDAAFIDRLAAIAIAAHADKAGQRLRDHHHLHHRRAVGDAVEREHDACRRWG